MSYLTGRTPSVDFLLSVYNPPIPLLELLGVSDEELLQTFTFLSVPFKTDAVIVKVDFGSS